LNKFQSKHVFCPNGFAEAWQNTIFGQINRFYFYLVLEKKIFLMSLQELLRGQSFTQTPLVGLDVDSQFIFPNQDHSSNGWWTRSVSSRSSTPYAPIDPIQDVLSRYHFMELSQTRSVYSEHPLNMNKIIIEKIVRMTLPTNPSVQTFLRQLKLYFYIRSSNPSEKTGERSLILPLKGLLQIHRKLLLDAPSDQEASWTPISVVNTEWTFVDHDDPNEKYNRLIFSPLKILPTDSSNSVNTYEVRIRFEPELPPNRSAYRYFVRGSDRQVQGNTTVLYPAMSVYLTTCPDNSESCRNLLIEVVSSLINIADQSGVYRDTEYDGAVSRVLSALPELRSNSSNKQGDFDVSDIRRELQAVRDVLSQNRTSTHNFAEWAGQINIAELSRLRKENEELRKQINRLELSK
jgi:hypothetical protein